MLVLIGIALAILYLGLLYAAPRSAKPVLEPASVVTQPNVFRNVAAGLVIFFLLDGVIFHSGIYERILEPQSYAGVVSRALRGEKQRPGSHLNQILFLGDSRIGRGFSEKTANEIAPASGVSFVKRAVPASTPQFWCYFLREVDPEATRYQAILLPVKFKDVERHTDPATEIAEAALLLHWTDAWAFASSFRQWKYQCKAFAACLVRGTAFQSDVLDFVQHPVRRIASLRRPSLTKWEELYRDDVDLPSDRRSVADVSFDPVSKQLKFPPGSPYNHQRITLEESVEMLEHPRWVAENYDWTKWILQRYAASPTSIILVELPRGPFASQLKPAEAPRYTAADLVRGNVSLIDAKRFAFLEAPEYYVDGYHLNQGGRRLFTQRLAQEVFSHLHRRADQLANRQTGAAAGISPP